MADDKKFDINDPDITSDEGLASYANEKKLNAFKGRFFSPRVIMAALGFALLFIILLVSGILSGNDSNDVEKEEAKKNNIADNGMQSHFDKLKFMKMQKAAEKDPNFKGSQNNNANQHQGVISEKKETKADNPPLPTDREKPAMFQSKSSLEHLDNSDLSKELEQINTANAQNLEKVHSFREQAFFNALTGSSKANVQLTSANNSSENYEQESQIANARSEIERAKQQLAQLNNGGTSVGGFGFGGDFGGGNGGHKRANRNSDYQEFNNQNDWTLGNTLETPSSKYNVRAGMVIPAVLVSGINSDQPGQCLAQVTQNVYDSATGKYLLIPQGTRLVGSYGTNVDFGQERMLIAWQRLVYPDDRTIDIGSMPGADMSGFSGFSDQVNNHWWKLISSSLLMSGISAGVSISVDGNDNNSDEDSSRLSSTLRENMATQLGEVITKVIEKNLNVSPTLEIRSGYKFNVIVKKDLTFDKPYQEFGY